MGIECVNATIQTRHSCRICDLIPCCEGKDDRRSGGNTWLNGRCSCRNSKITIESRLGCFTNLCHDWQIIIGDIVLNNGSAKPFIHGKGKSLCEAAVTRWKIWKWRGDKVGGLIGNPICAINNSIPRSNGLTAKAAANFLNRAILHIESF